MSTKTYAELEQEILDLKKEIRNLKWQVVRLIAGNEAVSQVRCQAIVDSEKEETQP